VGVLDPAALTSTPPLRAPLSGGHVSAASQRTVVIVPPMRVRLMTTTLAALAVAGLVGACSDGSEEGSESGSGDGGSGEQAGEGQELYDWVECMAGEGIELPEPSPDADGDLVIVGDGVNIGAASEVSLGEYSQEEFRAGAEVCGLPPMRSGLSEESLREEEDNALAFSQCMRDNGVDDFPDPDFADDLSDGQFSPWPPEAVTSAETDPDFDAADEACRDIMVPPGMDAADEGEGG
jgi:hypothetical protein